MNPFKENPFKNLSKNQKYAVAGGVVLFGGFLVIRHHKSTGSWNPFSAGSGAAGTQTGTDPITGLPYADDSQIDPLTGQGYLAEAQQYGSVQAAEAAVSSFGATVPTGTGYGQNPASGGSTGSSGSTASSAAYASNSDWVQAVTAGLSEIGYSLTTIDAGIQGYFASQELPAQEYQAMKVALSEFGPPPNGSFQLLQAPTQGPGKTMVTVPDVTGVDVEQATGILKTAGLKATGPAGVKGKIHVVTSTRPAKNSQVTSGSTVALNYKTVTEGVPVTQVKGHR